MVKNTGNGYRNGSVNDRTQTYNPQNNTYIKRNRENGQFMDVSKNQFIKGIIEEKDGRRN